MAFQPPSVASIFVFLTLLIFPASHSIPFIVLHGISDQCKNRGVKHFTKQLMVLSGSPGYCLYVNFSL
uniref:Uncharacterized protein n=1 Tax=Rhizophora mucronata TaxID=61149 RepID=A0A2P2ME74_RHIMU